jgi:hypothetical protein
MPNMKDYYFDKQELNTPANDVWSIALKYGFSNRTGTFSDLIYFSSTGEVDMTKTDQGNYTNAQALLREAENQLNAKSNLQVDLWKLINWIYVVQYWTLLYDLGQVQPTLYERVGTFPSHYSPYTYSVTNNIFINPALFQIYNNYFQSTIIPLLGIKTAPPTIPPPNSTNSLTPLFVTFQMGYLCTETQQKAWPSLILAIAIGDYTILCGSYGVFKLLADYWLRGRKRNNNTSTWT